MRLLLDTHLLIWDFTGDVRFSPEAICYLEDERNELYYSSVSTWEIALKHTAHPDRMLLTPERFVQYCEMAEYRNLPIKDDHIKMTSLLKATSELPVNSDPFDRLLLAQAKAEGMLLLTHDGLLSRYDEACIVRV